MLEQFKGLAILDVLLMVIFPKTSFQTYDCFHCLRFTFHFAFYNTINVAALGHHMHTFIILGGGLYKDIQTFHLNQRLTSNVDYAEHCVRTF